jgi:hypothetical protein
MLIRQPLVESDRRASNLDSSQDEFGLFSLGENVDGGAGCGGWIAAGFVSASLMLIGPIGSVFSGVM